jgi:hypothetical protein
VLSGTLPAQQPDVAGGAERRGADVRLAGLDRLDELALAHPVTPLMPRSPRAP